ncbi:l-aminoadipate-semialdehyde dehydrogenase [Lichtheimia corymbifera JMRC:FSU:9682]|uniref:L-aminoadipate-semialdehyde dehydrogenase n=1 Tax=Lichtheimia corymbifera JMRC:FSU:9682 TaxID=1263082 RepID=A0A068RJM9_9FUNG|nr:l-aminoadipate-semialdehyde dehydrogenase [Lichtheimia corymbifera JMRC:FSU:9682]
MAVSARKIYDGPVYDWKDYHAFIHLFETLAKENSDRTCIYYRKGSTYKTLTWEQVDRISTNLACRWSYFFDDLDAPVAVLADHSLDYLFYMIALLKLRVVLQALSPRNTQAAVTNMLIKGKAGYIMASEKYADTGKTSADQVQIPYQTLLPFDIEALSHEPLNPDAERILNKQYTTEDEEKIVIITHSSGTTAFPKLIPLSNRYMFVHVQHFTHDMAHRYGEAPWTLERSDIFMVGFPLFHIGGIFQAFCAMMHHGTSVYSPLPLQVKDVVDAIEQCGVTYVYFAPVLVDQIATYIKETGDIAPFKKLKVIQFGGAPLRPDLGEFLTSHGIRLQCCYGASEFAISFLNDDTRDDIPWNSTRPSHIIKDYCHFEPYDEQAGTYHLVIKSGAPNLATGVENRPDGFGTNDLFIQDPPNSGYWRHLGRKDDILVMENAQKTNPTPMEFAICSASIVKSCTVIGEGRQCTATLVELEYEQAIQYTPSEIIEQVHAAVANANANAPNYSIILPEMIYILPLSKHLPTTVKGNVVRKSAIKEFEDVIESMYTNFMQGTGNKRNQDTSNTWPIQDIESLLVQAASNVLGKSPALISSNKDQSLFDLGLNSLLAIQLRNAIVAKFGPISNTFLYEHPSIQAIATALKSPNAVNSNNEEQRYQETQALLESYIERAKVDFSPCITNTKTGDEQHVVLLTGSTGALGAFILRDLIRSPKVSKIYCPVRVTTTNGMDRIIASFNARRLDVSLLDSGKVEALPMDLNAEYLGWSKELYDRLKQEITIVQACGWLVDFNQPITHFDKECIQGLYNLLKFAHRPTNPMHVHTVSSVSATCAMKNVDRISETTLPQDPHVAMPIGYAQSKYIAEHLFDYLTREKGMPCIVERMGQVCGDTVNGTWSIHESYPLMMVGGGAMLKKMPNVSKMTINWIPIDYAASSITDIMLNTTATPIEELKGRVFHIVNPNHVSWSDVLQAMQECGMQFDVVEPKEWITELMTATCQFLRQQTPSNSQTLR